MKWNHPVRGVAAGLFLAAFACVELSAGAPGRATRAFEILPLVLSGERLDPTFAPHFEVLVDAGGLDDSGNVGMWGTTLFEGPDYFTYLYLVNGDHRTLVDVRDINDLELFPSRLYLNNRGEAVYLRSERITQYRSDDVLAYYADGESVDILRQGDPIGPRGSIVREISPSPSINDNGQIAFLAYAVSPENTDDNAAYLWEGGQIRRLIGHGDPAPGGGVFRILQGGPPPSRLNENGDVLLWASISHGELHDRYGLFLVSVDGVRVIQLDGTPMPTGGVVYIALTGGSDLNNRGDVVFRVTLSGGTAEDGIFMARDGRFIKIVAAGDIAPSGEPFLPLFRVRFRDRNSEPYPAINDLGTVAFIATTLRSDGSKRTGVYLANETAMVKVVADGDLLPTGEPVRNVTSFALNDSGQIAFTSSLQGLFLATPTVPEIERVKLRGRDGALRLSVDGRGLIRNDTVIEVNGVAVDQIRYPSKAREPDGATRTVVGTDSRLDDLLPRGVAVSVTVYNSLTGSRSAPFTFTRR